MRKKSINSSVIDRRLEEIDCISIPSGVRHKINELYAIKLAQAEVDIACNLITADSVSAIFREVMCATNNKPLLDNESTTHDQQPNGGLQ